MSARLHRESTSNFVPVGSTGPGQELTRGERYSAAKQYLVSSAGLKDDVRTHFLSSLVAGTVATTICAPADVLKSRIQSASAAAGSGSVSLRQLLPFHLCDGFCGPKLTKDRDDPAIVDSPGYPHEPQGGGPPVPHEGVDARLVAIDVSLSSRTTQDSVPSPR